MNKSFKSAVAAAAVALGVATLFNVARAGTLQGQVRQELQVKAGDVIVQKNKNGYWDAIRILLIDKMPDGSETAHCLMYPSAAEKPAYAALRTAPAQIWHAPIRASSFAVGWERLGNDTVSKQQFGGFIEYLKHTDFPRYIAFTGQDSKVVVQRAHAHYERANGLSETGQRRAAIVEYGLAIEMFPLFYEAIDNRAFTRMDLGNYSEALADFEQSLSVNPNGAAAFFSKGECLMRLGRLSDAEAIFSEGQTKFPAQRELFAKFLAQVRGMKSKG